MSLYCLSHNLDNDLVCYNNEKNISLKNYKNNEMTLTMPLHSGTHIDFPYHVFDDGKKSSDYNLQDFVFNNPYVVEINSNDDYFSTNELKEVPTNVDFLIIKNNKRIDGGISEKVAQYIKKNFKNIKCVGTNTISINALNNKEQGKLAHKIFLSQPEVLIVEHLNLEKIKNNCLKKVTLAPLPIENADGVPVIAIGEV